MTDDLGFLSLLGEDVNQTEPLKGKRHAGVSHPSWAWMQWLLLRGMIEVEEFDRGELS